MKINKHNGFTLLELMIVIAIIGIITSIALPAYQSYIIRSKITEVLNFSGYSKTTMWESHFSKGTMPEESELIISELENTLVSSKFINSATYKKNGHDHSEITLTLQNLGNQVSNSNNTIVIDFNAISGNITMECHRGSLNQSYRPASCRFGS